MKINWTILLAWGVIVWTIVWVQTTLITVVAILGAIFYVSYTSRHYWMEKFRPLDESTQDTRPIVPVGGTDSEGRALRSHNYHTDK